MEEASKNTGQARRILGSGHLAACAMLLAPLSAFGQSSPGVLADPMRPADARAAVAAATPQAGRGPQVILISPQRKLAVIDGALVPMGSETRDGTLVGLTDSAVVLRKDSGQDVLLMHPRVDKRPPSRGRP